MLSYCKNSAPTVHDPLPADGVYIINGDDAMCCVSSY